MIISRDTKFACREANFVVTVPSRYQRFFNLQNDATWLNFDKERLNTPKGHQILHFLSFMLMFGAPDLARLNNSEKDHQPYAKDASKRTRRHHNTQMMEMHPVVNRYEAVRAAAGYEWAPQPLITSREHVFTSRKEELLSRETFCG